MKPRLFGILIGSTLPKLSFWQEYLRKSEWALAIREAGKKIR